MSDRPDRKLFRLQATAENFAVVWKGKAIQVRGGPAGDGDLAVVTLSGDLSEPEVVGRCSGGYFFPTYRTKEA